jgi:advillin
MISQIFNHMQLQYYQLIPIHRHINYTFLVRLHYQDAFIIDNGTRGIWVWIGKKASPKERTEAMRNAQGFIRKKGYPDHTPVTRVIDGGEPEEFRSLFAQWKVKNETVGYGRQHSAGRGIASISQNSFDASTLHEKPQLAAKMGMIDDGTGAKEVYKVNQFKLVELPQQFHGSFFEHDCYVVKYTANGPGEHILVYFWLVSQCREYSRITKMNKCVISKIFCNLL